jgi:hypothetical protein
MLNAVRPPRTGASPCDDGVYSALAKSDETLLGQFTMATAPHRIFTTAFASVYPLYVTKAERKGRTKDEVDRIVCWLTGYSAADLALQLERRVTFSTFFADAPCMHPNVSLITGVVCGVRVEHVDDPLMQKIRYLDKLIDELAKGRAMEKILRS